MQRPSVRRDYDRFAPRYDAIFEARQTPKITALAAALPADWPGPVADLGAGTGLVSRVLADRLPMGAVGVDISREMLRRGAGRRVQGDLERLPLADGHFGLVFSVSALIDLGDPRPALAEMARVLRPGGWLALSVLKTEDLAAVQHGLDAVGLPIVRRLDLQFDLGFICRAAL